MISLFLDTASNDVIISLFKDETLIDEIVESNSKQLSSDFIPLLDKILKANNMDVKEIDRIYSVTGPGSFTGIRVGVTTSKLIAYCLNKEVVPISELEVMATTKVDADYVVPIIDARRDAVYAGIYTQNLKNILPDTRILLSDLKRELEGKNYVFVGDYEIEDIVKPKYNTVEIIKKHKNDPSVNPHLLNPNYLKLTEAEEKLNDSKNN